MAVREQPEPGPGEVRLRVRACGVCRTDLHLAEGDLAPRRPDTVPGHEVVGVVDALGPADGEEFLRLAGALRVRPRVTARPLGAADEVLADLAADRVEGAAVLVPG